MLALKADPPDSTATAPRPAIFSVVAPVLVPPANSVICMPFMYAPGAGTPGHVIVFVPDPAQYTATVHPAHDDTVSDPPAVSP